MGRKASRELTMKLIFQYDFQTEDVENFVEESMNEEKLEKADREYVKSTFDGVVSNLKSIDDKISQNARGWKMTRMSKVDVAILRLAIYEMIHRDDIPLNVTINEAVELAKKYSTKDSSSFINGILGNIIKTIDTPQCEDTVKNNDIGNL